MSDEAWWYVVGGSRRGPLSAAGLKRLAEAGRLRPDDLVWRPGLPEWVAADKVRGLFEAAPAAAAAGPTPDDRRLIVSKLRTLTTASEWRLILRYTDAVAGRHGPDRDILAHRAHAWMRLGDHGQAVADADAGLRLAPAWGPLLFLAAAARLLAALRVRGPRQDDLLARARGLAAQALPSSPNDEAYLELKRLLEGYDWSLTDYDPAAVEKNLLEQGPLGRFVERLFP
jgi:hypothetical protein